MRHGRRPATDTARMPRTHSSRGAVMDRYRVRHHRDATLEGVLPRIMILGEERPQTVCSCDHGPDRHASASCPSHGYPIEDMWIEPHDDMWIKPRDLEFTPSPGFVPGLGGETEFFHAGGGGRASGGVSVSGGSGGGGGGGGSAKVFVTSASGGGGDRVWTMKSLDKERIFGLTVY